MRRAHVRTVGMAAVLVIGLAAASGVGCGPDTGPLDPGMPPGQPGAVAPAAPVAPVAAAGAEPAEPAPADTYIYTPVGKRDPFKSFYKEEKKLGAGDKGQSPTTELQLYEIDQLKLIAVVSGISQPKAMVVTPDSRGHTVKIGTLIGKNFGRVVRIKTSEVVIAEDYRDPIGRKVTNYITMALEQEKR